MAPHHQDIPVPSHRYIPGLTPRHSDNWFDDIKASVDAHTPSEHLHETLAFRAGRLYFDLGFYWECHQVLDVVWMQTKDPSAERDMVLALIQLANARLKTAMNQPLAAWRLCDMVETRLSRCPTDRAVLGLHVVDMQSLAGDTRLASRKPNDKSDTRD